MNNKYNLYNVYNKYNLFIVIFIGLITAFLIITSYINYDPETYIYTQLKYDPSYTKKYFIYYIVETKYNYYELYEAYSNPELILKFYEKNIDKWTNISYNEIISLVYQLKQKYKPAIQIKQGE